MATPVLYKWDDPGAPQLNVNSFDSILTWITTLCNDGYVGKPGLGWTVESDGNTIYLTQGGGGAQHITVSIDFLDNNATYLNKGIIASEGHLNFIHENTWLSENAGYQYFGPAGSFNPSETIDLNNTITISGFNSRADDGVCGFFMNPDGTKFTMSSDAYYSFNSASQYGYLVSYTLSIPFNIGSIVTGTSNGLGRYTGLDNVRTGLHIGGATGNQYYQCDDSDGVHQFDNTIVKDYFTNYYTGGSTRSRNTNLYSETGFTMSDAGTEAFSSNGGGMIYQHALSTAFNISTMPTVPAYEFNASNWFNNIREIHLTTNGSWMYVAGQKAGNTGITRFSLFYLPDANDIRTMVFVKDIDQVTLNSDRCACWGSDDLAHMYLSTNADGKIRYYNGSGVTNTGDVNLPWIVVGNNRSFYLIAGYTPTLPADHPHISENGLFSVQFFGDYVSNFESDKNQMVIAESQGVVDSHLNDESVRNWADGFFSGTKWRLHTDHTELAQGIYAGPFVQGRIGQPKIGLRYPYIDGNTYVEPVQIKGEDGVLYGRLPGAYHTKHNKSIYANTNGYQILNASNGGPFGGREMLVVTANDDVNGGQLILDLTADWGV